MFTAPSDGYICVQCWNNSTSSLNLWFNKNTLMLKMNQSARQEFMVFAVKGSKWHVTGSGNDRSAYFLSATL